MKFYVKLVLVMFTMSGLTGCVSTRTDNTARLGKGVFVVESDIQKIVRSPIDFKYERPDQEDLVRFRKQAKLDEVIGNGTDFEQLVRLMDWVGSAKRDNDSKLERGPNGYRWGVKHLFEMDENGKPVIHGHCMSFAAVMVDACSALGFKARHFANEGFRQMSHEVVEVWVPSLGRWIYFDPSLTQYYMDIETGAPLSILEIHNIVIENFIPENKDMVWFAKRKNPETREEVRRVGGQKPIKVRQGLWHWGKPVAPGYDWGWLHGYLAAGYLQMTPRNDFNSHPKANPGKFGDLPGYAGYPFWVDEKTPAKPGVKSVFSKKSDFYWTLDQAAFKLDSTCCRPGVMKVKLENSMPFFSHYKITLNGVSQDVKDNFIEWPLSVADNTIEVVPVDIFGKTGQGSRAIIRYEK